MILFHHKTKWYQQKIPKVYMSATISIFCLFIRVYDVIYVEIQFNRSKSCNFTSLLKMVKNTIKHYYRRCFLHESKKKCKENQGGMFYTFAGVTYLCWTQSIVTLWLHKIWSKHHKTLYKALSRYNQQKSGIKAAVKLSPEFPFKRWSVSKMWKI